MIKASQLAQSANFNNYQPLEQHADQGQEWRARMLQFQFSVRAGFPHKLRWGLSGACFVVLAGSTRGSLEFRHASLGNLRIVIIFTTGLLFIPVPESLDTGSEIIGRTKRNLFPYDMDMDSLPGHVVAAK